MTLPPQGRRSFLPVKELLGSSIKIGTKLSESSNLSVLGQLKLHGTRHLNKTIKINLLRFLLKLINPVLPPTPIFKVTKLFSESSLDSVPS